MTTVNQTLGFLEVHLAQARFAPYLTACNQDVARAEAMYTWNTELAAAFWGPLGYLEVAVRNALATRMDDRHLALGRPGSWIFDDARELGRDGKAPGVHKHPFVDIVTARRRVSNNKKQPTPGQIISETGFGFWHQMVSQRQLSLWPDLASAFPSAPDRNQLTVHDPLARLRDFRNRIGHHHRIWNADPAARYQDLLLVASYIDQDLADWIDSRSQVLTILGQQP